MNAKFRGFSKESNEWIFGYYYKIKDCLKDEYRHFIVYENNGPGTQTVHESVEECSVGQYSGINDIEGNEIFEGDLVSIITHDLSMQTEDFEGVVKFCEGSFIAENKDKKEAYLLFSETNEVKVIGNTYLTPTQS